jgi:threonine aldolase
VIDLRSDTASKPTRAMREAIAAAEVGDEQLREDPTVNELERRAASILGQEDAVFVPTATMANEIALRVLAEPGDELIAEENAHLLIAELGGPAVHAGVMTRPLRGEAGRFSPEQVRAAARQGDLGHQPTTRIVAIENTHNGSGGRVWPVAEVAAMAETCRELELAFHLDGARLFNAAVALKRNPREFSRSVDSVTFCLSKGLGAPVGSLICGTADFIGRARRLRKMVGGGMRQAGILAAAGLVALERMVDRLAEDHVNARALAEGVAKLPGITVDLASVQTNIVIFGVARAGGAGDLVKGGAARKVKLHAIGPAAIRCVTHKDVDAEDIARALDAFREITRGW